MLKVILVIISFVFFGTNSFAVGAVFTCKQKLRNTNLSMTVKESNGGYIAYLEGSTLGNQPVSVMYKSLTPVQAKQDAGVVEILKVMKISTASWAKVKNIDYYLLGNLEDDAAGILGVSIKSTSGAIFGKGMFYGWAGPMKCQAL